LLGIPPVGMTRSGLDPHAVHHDLVIPRVIEGSPEPVSFLIRLPAGVGCAILPPMCGTRTYAVYILASATGTLYVGMTGDLKRRIWQHQNELVEGFTRRYDVTRLIHVESFGDALSAIAREKQIKAWRREKKVSLIDSCNPQWRDLSSEL